MNEVPGDPDELFDAVLRYVETAHAFVVYCILPQWNGIFFFLYQKDLRV
jgi:hypothetical protein